ncbi:DUF485 domain-containing protein [Desulfurispira natronophila]|uniref:Uncharacterized membrane protein (DUF485 family) n=1 Tax=Desulfurispira natronophila TaxID=682562 RepID=A0A7W8DGP4_9BACT|nr:DUF485 domain-containing protein [Desulfurispira natronophila]MBB5021468.1 uncharacterized membrane protein (DUF485 family) [Desulfurispira natronophila]
MDKKLVDAIYNSEDFHKLTRTRSRFAMRLTVALLVAYGIFLFCIAFFPDFFAIPIPFLTHQIIPIGIAYAIGVICFAFFLTALYVHRANQDFDSLNQEIRASFLAQKALLDKEKQEGKQP